MGCTDSIPFVDANLFIDKIFAVVGVIKFGSGLDDETDDDTDADTDGDANADANFKKKLYTFFPYNISLF